MVDPIRLSIRPATVEDVAFLAVSHRNGHEAVREERGGRLDILLRGHGDPVDEAMHALISDADTTVTIGEVDDIAVGYLVLQFLRLRSGEEIAQVKDFWVHPDARGVGVGSSLMRNALDAATSRGCSGIDARALPGDRVTKNFFESFGLVARTIEVHKPL